MIVHIKMGSTLLVILAMFSFEVNAKGCEFDVQCKGERVCESGRCVSVKDIDDELIDKPKSTLPRFCCTDVGKLGPYPNPGNVYEGDNCWGTTRMGQVAYGRACF